MRYPLFKVHVNVDEAMGLIREVLESGYINEGVQVAQLADGFKAYLKADNLVLTNSCTSALTMALDLAGVRYCDDVISTPMTCVATNCPIVTRQADIVWADIDPMTGCMDPTSLREVLKDHPARAVIAVAWAGIPPDLQELRDACDDHGIPLILDAAHAMGATYKGRPIHEWADFTCYSLQAIKHVTTGDGGILVVRSKEDHGRAKGLKWFGIDRDEAKDSEGNWRGQHWDFDIVTPGYKFNMNNLAAAVGLSQLSHVEDIVKAHRKNAALYEDLFATSSFIKTLKATYELEASHWVYTVRLDAEKVDKHWLLQELNNEGIGAGLVHVPNQGYTCFDSYYRTLPGVTTFSREQLSLPVGWWLSEDDIRHIHARVEALCESYVS